MSTIKAIDKLRTAARNMAKGRNLENHEECNLLIIIADEIEAEVEERYMPLPLDADGVPIRVGDKLTFNMNDPGICTGYDWLKSDGKWMIVVRRDWHNGCVFLAHDKAHHVKPSTLEDMLADFVNSSVRVGCKDGISSEMRLYADGAAIARCAEEIRAMFGEVD